jgi:hypothetical protein
MMGCRAYRQSSSDSKVCLRNATTTAAFSADTTVDPGSFGPVGRSETEVRAFHLGIVLGLTPSASQALSGSLDYAVSLDGPPLSLWRSRVEFVP